MPGDRVVHPVNCISENKIKELQDKTISLSNDMKVVIGRLDSLIKVLTKIGWMVLACMVGALGYFGKLIIEKLMEELVK